MIERDLITERPSLVWHSFHSGFKGIHYVLYFQHGLTPSDFDPAKEVRITGSTAEVACANALAFARDRQQVNETATFDVP